MKRFLPIVFLLLLFSAGCVEKGDIAMNLTGKKILMVVAFEGFRDEEFEEPYKIFTEAGASVTVASWQTGEAKGMLGKTITINTTINDVNVDDFDAVVFVGGIGAKNYYDNEVALNIAKNAYEKGKIVAAICIAPGILAKAGILQGKKATIWDSGNGEFIALLKEGGATYTGANVERDGNVITANGPHAAEEFGKTIASILTNE